MAATLFSKTKSAGAACLLALACCESHLISTVSDRPLDVSSDWVVMMPKEPLIAKRKVRELQVTLPRVVRWKESELPRAVFTLPNGEEFVLQAQLIDQGGAVWPLEAVPAIESEWRGHTLILPAKGLPDRTRIKTVKLRSTSP
jgi:hypothetical protein